MPVIQCALMWTQTAWSRVALLAAGAVKGHMLLSPALSSFVTHGLHCYRALQWDNRAPSWDSMDPPWDCMGFLQLTQQPPWSIRYLPQLSRVAPGVSYTLLGTAGEIPWLSSRVAHCSTRPTPWGSMGPLWSIRHPLWSSKNLLEYTRAPLWSIRVAL